MTGQPELPQSNAFCMITHQQERKKMMNTIDPSVLADYNAGIEYGRLRRGIGLIEWERSAELLREYLPPAPAVIYDIGGGYGEYAWYLADLGYEVHLFDLAETHIAMSHRLSSQYPNAKLAAAEVCDARQVPRPDSSADAVLLMGPLYHITQERERLRALRECRRLLKPGGILAAAALTPYSVLLHAISVYRSDAANANSHLEEEAFMQMVERELKDGQHINPEHAVYPGLGTSYLHTAQRLRTELMSGGFSDIHVHGMMGGAWLAHDIEKLWEDPTAREALMRSIRLLDGHNEIIGLSGHLLAFCTKS